MIGPWHHGQEIEDGSTLGALKFNSDTGLYFRQQILRPFLDHYLKDDAPKADVPPVSAFETGTNTWRKLNCMAVRSAPADARLNPRRFISTSGLKLASTRRSGRLRL